jgi:pyridoxine 4-dehydrogenase
VVSVQNRYSIADRGSEDVLEYCEKEKWASSPGSRWRPAECRVQPAPSVAWQRESKLRHAQVALAWLLARSPVMLPIPGTSKVAHLEENVAAAGLKIDENKMHDLRLTA